MQYKASDFETIFVCRSIYLKIFKEVCDNQWLSTFCDGCSSTNKVLKNEANEQNRVYYGSKCSPLILNRCNGIKRTRDFRLRLFLRDPDLPAVSPLHFSINLL